MRAECLDWLLIVGRGHLEQVLRVYVQHYNAHRAHRALGQQPPDPAVGLTLTGRDQPAQGTDTTCSVASCMSTGELHERIRAPYALRQHRRQQHRLRLALGQALTLWCAGSSRARHPARSS